MDGLFWLNALSRWLHVTSAVIGVGAIIFVGLVLSPVMAAQEPSVRQAVMERLLPRFIRVVHAAIGLLLLTGVYNLVVVIPKVRALTYHSLYHSLIGTKILLALVFIGITTAVLPHTPPFATMEGKQTRWATLNIVLALVILLLGAILRRLWDFR